MTCRGMKLESDVDNLIADDLEDKLKKFMAQKNCKKEAALRWALQRATDKKEREMLMKAVNDHFSSGESLLDI